MPIDPTKVAVAVNDGLSIVCAMCENFWSAHDAGLSSCGKKCGGPMSGGAFDKYKGPIVDFSSFCFVCGDSATHGIRAVGNVRILGCCDKHVDTVKQWKVTDLPPVNISIKSDDVSTSTDEESIPRPRVKLRVL
jgi:hypothetical protein